MDMAYDKSRRRCHHAQPSHFDNRMTCAYLYVLGGYKVFNAFSISSNKCQEKKNSNRKICEGFLSWDRKKVAFEPSVYNNERVGAKRHRQHIRHISFGSVYTTWRHIITDRLDKMLCVGP